MSVNSQVDVSISLTLLDCFHLNNLTQLVEKPTRENNILDLLLTSNPNIAKNEFHAPSPSHDHVGIFFGIDIRPKLNPKLDHHIYLYKKADMDKLEQEIDNIAHEFCAKHNSSDFSADENWNHFKLKLHQAIDKHVPQKHVKPNSCLLYTSPSPRDLSTSRMPSSA